VVSIHTLAERHLPNEGYTIERREFQDGDERTVAVHHVGWSSTTYLTYKLWKELGEIWIEYHEHDVRRDRRVFSYELTDRVIANHD
jgi:hypothetical protein